MSFVPPFGRAGARWALVAVAAVAVLAAAGLVMSSCGGPARRSAASQPSEARDRRPAGTQGITTVATPRSSAPRYAAPGARRRGTGVGTSDDPTPTGAFFLAFNQPPPSPNSGYGAFIMVTSAHSTSIKDWQGSGDAIIGIHGPLGRAAEIGTRGARNSHGCVRLHDHTLARLRHVPPGTPIDVVG